MSDYGHSRLHAPDLALLRRAALHFSHLNPAPSGAGVSRCPWPDPSSLSRSCSALDALMNNGVMLPCPIGLKTRGCLLCQSRAENTGMPCASAGAGGALLETLPSRSLSASAIGLPRGGVDHRCYPSGVVAFVYVADRRRDAAGNPLGNAPPDDSSRGGRRSAHHGSAAAGAFTRVGALWAESLGQAARLAPSPHRAVDQAIRIAALARGPDDKFHRGPTVAPRQGPVKIDRGSRVRRAEAGFAAEDIGNLLAAGRSGADSSPDLTSRTPHPWYGRLATSRPLR